MRNFFPKTLRYKMLLLTLIIVSVPILITGYMVKLQARDALLVEKQIKLFGVAQLLDEHLGAGFYNIMKNKQVLHADRATKIKVLNEQLAHYTDVVAGVDVGIGVGYYSKELDAIITYGPSSRYINAVGVSIEDTHPGRKVMETGEKMVEFGPLVRGNIMNAMLPITRNGEIIGYIWANELTDDIQKQVTVMDKNIYTAVIFGIIIALILIVILTGHFVEDVERIKRGLERLKFDLKKPIEPISGEMGEIVAAINHMAQSLLDAHSLNENIMYSMADGVITVDIHGVITTSNPAAQKITGFMLDEVIGKPFRTVFGNVKQFQNLLLDPLGTRTHYSSCEIDYPVRDTCLYISASSTMLKDSDENIIGAVVVLKDLTQQHQLQEQVYRAERLAALGELMASIAHEIRNPLTAIKGFVQYLQDVDSHEERQEYMPIIIKEVDRVNHIIEELLYFSRPVKAHYTLVDIKELLEKTLVLVKNKTTSHKVEFHLNFANGLPLIEADAEQIKQVLLNLLINAIQAIPNKGSIDIDVWQNEETYLCVRVTDTGTGIKAEDVQNVFDPFFTTKTTGTGLGLAVVQRIISAHYGRVDINSIVNEGTIVTLKLPVTHWGGYESE